MAFLWHLLFLLSCHLLSFTSLFAFILIKALGFAVSFSDDKHECAIDVGANLLGLPSVGLYDNLKNIKQCFPRC
jgi:hypothetical protein